MEETWLAGSWQLREGSRVWGGGKWGEWRARRRKEAAPPGSHAEVHAGAGRLGVPHMPGCGNAGAAAAVAS